MTKTKGEFQKTNRKLGLICFLVVNVWLAFPAGAWGPFAHFTAAPSATQSQQNLPDLWESNAYTHGFDFPDYHVGKEVSEYFGWSHACQRNGLLDAWTGTVSIGPVSIPLVSVVYPKTPTEHGVPAGVELPGADMYYIYANKFLAGNQTLLRKRTAQGFRCHNVEDKVVHFSYFLGGSVYNWIVEHAFKERWAEFRVYVELGGDWNLVTLMPTMPLSMGCSADAGIINLGQKVFRKNRQTVDAAPEECDTIVVETAAEISTRISQQDAKLSSFFSGWWVANDFGLDNYAWYRLVAIAAGWDSSEVWTKYSQAKDDALTAIGTMP